jgi:protease-4
MSYKLYSAILKSAWFIDPGFVESHLPIVADILTRNSVTSSVPKNKDLTEDENIQPYAIVGGKVVSTKGSLRRGIDYNDVPKGSIAVIPVRGPLMKEDEDDCGYFIAGTATLSKRIQEADEHKNIIGIILHFDTPGGTIDGIQAFSDSIKASKKPIVGFVDGMCASAGLYAASSCDAIIAQDITAEIGSIGTMMAWADTQPYYEKMGVKFHEIYSTLSPDKNLSWREAREGKYDLAIKEGLDPYSKIFQNQVKTNRPQVKDDSMTGKMYMAEDALKRGLIDEIGGINVAAKKVEELAKAKAEAPTNKTKQEMKQFPKLNSLLKLESLESTDEGCYLNEEQLQAVEDRITSAEASESELATAKTDLETVKAEVKTKDEQLAKNVKTIESLKEKPATTTAVAPTSSDSTSEESDSIITICETDDTATAAAKLKEMGL